MLRKILQFSVIVLLQTSTSICLADTLGDHDTALPFMEADVPDPSHAITTQLPTTTPSANVPDAKPDLSSPVEKRATAERLAQQSSDHPFALTFYKPTYVLPYYYTFTPYNSIYQGNTPNGESLKNDEIKYQLSFKVPIWRNIFGSLSSLYFAYTQMSYWQAYNKYAFFRSTDFEPEVFLANHFAWHLGQTLQLNFINFGLVHQSNGFGNNLERSWNRAYMQITASTEHFMFTLKPWIVFHDNTYNRQNPDMAYYLGHEEIIMAFKYGSQVVAIDTRNLLESRGKRTGTTVTWSFPVTKYINGYLQVFTGYGQSLIEYNHHTNSVGLGIALSNWI
jgi:phospholipase A1